MNLPDNKRGAAILQSHRDIMQSLLQRMPPNQLGTFAMSCCQVLKPRFDVWVDSEYAPDPTAMEDVIKRCQEHIDGRSLSQAEYKSLDSRLQNLDSAGEESDLPGEIAAILCCALSMLVVCHEGGSDVAMWCVNHTIDAIYNRLCQEWEAAGNAPDDVGLDWVVFQKGMRDELSRQRELAESLLGQAR